MVLEDDVSFDLVAFWPGALSSLLAEISCLEPDWSIVNLAPTTGFVQLNERPHFMLLWASRTHLLPWNNTFVGAVAYAVRRSPTLEATVRAAVACEATVAASGPRGARAAPCEQLLRQPADHVLYEALGANHPERSASPSTRLLPSHRGGASHPKAAPRRLTCAGRGQGAEWARSR